MSTRKTHPLARQTVILKTIRPAMPTEVRTDSDLIDGQEFVVEDWAENLWDGKTVMEMNGNPAAINYAFRAGIAGMDPVEANKDVVYGKVGYLGYCVHNSELVTKDEG